MNEKNFKPNFLLICQGFLAIIITILMFYPMFGGTLTVLNGTFVYFSYFLMLFVLTLFIIVDLIIGVQNSKNSTKEQQEVMLYSKVLFSFSSLIIMIGLLQGRYIVAPILGVFYIIVELVQMYQVVLEPKLRVNLKTMKFMEVIKKVVFYLTTIMLLVGNQPFEAWNLPVASSLLLVLNIVQLINWQKVTKE